MTYRRLDPLEKKIFLAAALYINMPKNRIHVYQDFCPPGKEKNRFSWTVQVAGTKFFFINKHHQELHYRK